MAYQSLYRKYRPTNFDEVYGQEVAKKILINSCKNNKISHAYLFFGPRGTGKTSIAKMFARICNCENSINGNCCEKCNNCINSKYQNCIDIIEIDAASNNGVDEIRELKNKINFVPNKLKYKVYIIDEVHMLSTGAFNALLKTLEEPPEYVIFILATTDFYKVPKTIVSRCQIIEFKNIDDKSMFNRLKEISNLEKILIENDAINEIVLNSNGGLRDAIGILDKVDSYVDNNHKINLNDIREVLGIVNSSEIKLMFDNIKKSNISELLKMTELYSSSGKDLYKILNEIIKITRDEIINNSNYDLISNINIMNNYYTKMKSSLNTKILFEMMIIELCSENEKKQENRVNLLNKKNINEKNTKAIDENIINIRINNCFATADKQFLKLLKEQWASLKEYTFDNDYGAIICDLIDTLPIVASKSYLMICCPYSSIANKINNDIDEYQKILNEKLGIKCKLVAVDTEQWNILKRMYINNIKNKIVYNYIDEKDKICDKIENEKTNINFEETAKELFGEIESI